MNLFEYALCNRWDERLEQLFLIAEPERWHYRKLPSDRKLPVLHDYVRFTFRRCFELGLVVEGDDQACFNTGLLTAHHEQIFAYFRAATPDIGPEDFQGRWWLHSWQVESSHHLARFDVLPGVASYWTDPATIVFDPRMRVIPQIDHIIEDNWERFPAEFGGTVGNDGIPQSLTAAPDEDEVMSQLVTDQDNDEPGTLESEVRIGSEVPERTRFILRNVLDGAVSRSVRLAERSYRVAVPQRYNGRIQLLLPLYLRGATDVDLALTLELQGDRYRAATVLLPDWAYTHARLLSRPNSEWLGGFRGES